MKLMPCRLYGDMHCSTAGTHDIQFSFFLYDYTLKCYTVIESVTQDEK